MHINMQAYLIISIVLVFCSVGFASDDQLCYSITDMLESLKTNQEALEAKQKRLEDRITEFTHSSRVAFHATNIAGSIAVGHTVKFVNVAVNDGDYYNPDTGLFTAPTNGTYLFSVNICTARSKWFQVHIKAGSIIIATVANYGSQGGQCTSASGLGTMVIGDIAQVEGTYYDEGGNNQDGRRHPSFSGVLLY